MRKRIYEIIELACEKDVLSKAYDLFMMTVIIISMIPLIFKFHTVAFECIEYFTAFVFIIDYLLRLSTADFKMGISGVKGFLVYPFTPMAIIDILSILPCLMLINGSFKLFRLLRLFKTMRVFRAFRILRYSKNYYIITNVFKRQKRPLMLVGALALTYILISAIIIFNIEPQTFDTFFDAVYWATVSLTTVGYGDIYPVTNIGRLVTMISSFFGIAVIALPAGIITAEYMVELNEENKRDDKNE